MALHGPFAAAAAACKSYGVTGDTDPLFVATMAAAHPADPIYDTVSIPRGVDFSDAANIAALENANGFDVGSVQWDATERVLTIPLFQFGRYNAGSSTPNRNIEDTNVYGGTFGSIHSQNGHHGVTRPEERGPWRSAFLAGQMAVDAWSDDGFSVTASDLNTLQKAFLEQEFIKAGRPVGNSPTHVGLVAEYPGIFRAHTGDGDGGVAISQYGKGSLATGLGLAPHKLPRPALVSLHDDSVNASPTRAYLTLRIPFAQKTPSNAVLGVTNGFDLVDDGTAAIPSVAAANQPDLRVRVTLFPKLDVNPKGPFADFDLRAYIARGA